MIRYLERHSSRFSTGPFIPPETVPWRGVEKPIPSYGWGLILNDVHYVPQDLQQNDDPLFGETFISLFSGGIRSSRNGSLERGGKTIPSYGWGLILNDVPLCSSRLTTEVGTSSVGEATEFMTYFYSAFDAMRRFMGRSQ
ncbi:hypothetical protein CDAR_609591 [Caerostris darwini]|uniref:Uncharacterized protein n=1 Tax=Caerostris darwini TaxID=1538125 RepID=A0AAV4SER8_9ARAC|nr:hypothetical protein CDAR_609591 [Caerostris darwini]